MQVGRKVAQVLESLGRSAETIQEAEVGSFVTNIITAGPVNARHRRHHLITVTVSHFFFFSFAILNDSPPCSRSGEEVLQGESQFEGPEGKQYLGRVQPAQQ